MADDLLERESTVPGAPARPPASAGAAPRRRRRNRSKYVMRAVAVAYVLILVLAPVTLVIWRTVQQGVGTFFDSLSTPEAIHAFQLTAVVVGLSVVINTVFGVGISLLIVRNRFPGRRLLDLLIDLPVSVSPIVVGLALILVYGSTTGWFGPALDSAGIQIIFATPGMVLATTFVSLPLVVREVIPVLRETGIDQEQAARSLGANAVQRFIRITLPTIKWALAYGVVLSLARSVGEFGAVKVVSGNVIGQTQTMTLLVDGEAEQLQTGYYQISLVLIAVSVICISIISILRPKAEK